MDLKPFNIIKDKSSEEIFQSDLHKSEAAGVKEPLAMPYFARRSKKGVLLIHGLSATPHEMLTIAEALTKEDISVYVVRVSGHGVSMERFAQVTCEDWYNGLLEGFSALSNCCDKIAVIGQSNGGLLATALALHNNVVALGLLAPAFKVDFAVFPIIKYAKNLPLYIPRGLTEEEKRYNYSGFPFKAIYQMKRLEDYITDNIEKLNLPVLLGVSQKDKLISPETAAEYLTKMKSIDKTLHIYDNKKLRISHILTLPYMDKIRQDIVDWSKRVLNDKF